MKGPLFVATDGTVCRGEPIDPVPVVAVVWTHAVGGSIERAVQVGVGNNVKDAERMIVDAGFVIRRPAHFIDPANGIQAAVTEAKT